MVKLQVQGHRLVHGIVGIRILVARLFCDALFKVLSSLKSDANVNFKLSARGTKAKSPSKSVFSLFYLLSLSPSSPSVSIVESTEV